MNNSGANASVTRSYRLTEPVWDFGAQAEKRTMVAIAVGHDAMLWALVSDTELPGGAISMLPSRVRYSILGSDELVDFSVTFRDRRRLHLLAPFDGWQWLVASSRCWMKAAGPERNALVIDSAGDTLRELTLGDGIEELQVGPRGDIWCSYFDEGIFGNLGWSKPLGAGGLLCFDGAGNVTFDYVEQTSAADVCDCYALNVASDHEVWLYYYTDFPLVWLRKGQPTRFEPKVSGAHAIAVARGYVALLGDYEQANVCRLFRMSKSTLQLVATWNLLLPQDDQRIGRAQGRGDAFYWLQGSAVYRLTLGELLADLA